MSRIWRLSLRCLMGASKAYMTDPVGPGPDDTLSPEPPACYALWESPIPHVPELHDGPSAGTGSMAS